FLAIAIGERLETFKDIPSVILTAPHDGDFLHAILPNVANPQVARDRIEAESPRLAESPGPDFGTRIGAITKRIVRGNRVREAGVPVIHVNAQNFAEMCGQVLAVALRVLLRAGVAHPDVE